MSDALETIADGTHYRVSGHGPPLVLIHGVGLDLEMWERLRPALEPTHRVIRYDMLGHGQSAKPPGPYGLEDFVWQLDRLTDSLGISRFDLVGFSMGGLVAQAFTIRFPERIHRLALLHTVHDRSPAERAAIATRVRLVEAGGLVESVASAIERWFTRDFRQKRPDVVARIERRMLTNDLEPYLACYRVFAAADAETASSVASIRCPSLVLTGADDVGSTAKMASALAARIANAKLVILPGLRHMAPVEAATEVGSVLSDFFGSHAVEESRVAAN